MEANISYYLSKEEPAKSCLLALRDIILSQDKNLVETTKYGMPCFCYKKKAFCYLWTDKITDGPYILMVEGKRLTHPLLEQGNRSRMKILRVPAGKNLNVKLIRSVLNEGLTLYT